jgi:hypothetical protein
MFRFTRELTGCAGTKRPTAGLASSSAEFGRLHMDQNTQNHVRERAYDIWEKEGRPDGCAERHWHQAQMDLDGHDTSTQIGPAESSETAQLSAKGAGFQPKMRHSG